MMKTNEGQILTSSLTFFSNLSKGMTKSSAKILSNHKNLKIPSLQSNKSLLLKNKKEKNYPSFLLSSISPKINKASSFKKGTLQLFQAGKPTWSKSEKFFSLQSSLQPKDLVSQSSKSTFLKDAKTLKCAAKSTRPSFKE